MDTACKARRYNDYIYLSYQMRFVKTLSELYSEPDMHLIRVNVVRVITTDSCRSHNYGGQVIFVWQMKT